MVAIAESLLLKYSTTIWAKKNLSQLVAEVASGGFKNRES